MDLRATFDDAILNPRTAEQMQAVAIIDGGIWMKSGSENKILNQQTKEKKNYPRNESP